MRIAWRDLIKESIHAVVTQPRKNALPLIQQAVTAQVPDTARANVQALIVEELRRLHEGVLDRHGLRPSELATWQARQSI